MGAKPICLGNRRNSTGRLFKELSNARRAVLQMGTITNNAMSASMSCDRTCCIKLGLRIGHALICFCTAVKDDHKPDQDQHGDHVECCRNCELPIWAKSTARVENIV